MCVCVLSFQHLLLLWAPFLYVFPSISMDYPDKTLHQSNKEKQLQKKESLVCELSLKKDD